MDRTFKDLYGKPSVSEFHSDMHSLNDRLWLNPTYNNMHVIVIGQE